MGTESGLKHTPVSHTSSSRVTTSSDPEAERRSERKERMDARREWSCMVLGLTFRNLREFRKSIYSRISDKGRPKRDKPLNLKVPTTSGPRKGDLLKEAVTLQRSKSIVQTLLGHSQVVFIEKWSLNRVVS